MAFVSIVFFFIRKDRYASVTKNAYTVSILFLISYFIVYFQNYIDLLLGNISQYDYLSIALPDAINKSVWISMTGLMSFFLGYLIFDKKKYKKKYKKNSNLSFVNTGNILILNYTLFVVYLMSVDFSYFRGGYSVVEQNSFNGFISVFFHASLYLYIVVKIANSVEKVERKNVTQILKEDFKFLLLLFVYLILILFSGERDIIISFAMSYLMMLLFISKSIITKKNFIILLFFSGLLIAILGITRNMGNEYSFSEKVLFAYDELNMEEDNSVFSVTSELAGSVRTLHAAVESVEYNGFWYGYFNFSNFITSIPLTGTLFSKIGVFDYKITSSTYLTIYLQGYNPKYGDGTSCIADLYLDFGILAVVLGMFFLGYIIRRVDMITTYNEKPNILSIILSVVLFSSIIIYPRAYYLYPLKMVVFVYILYFVFVLTTRRR